MTIKLVDRCKKLLDRKKNEIANIANLIAKEEMKQTDITT